MKTLNLLKYISLCCAVCCGLDSAASSKKLTFEGVVSAGYLSPSANTFVRKEAGKGAFLSENIFRANYSLGNGFSATGQVFLRRGGDFVDESLQLDFLQLEYRDDVFSLGEQSFVLGRFKINSGLYNQSRDISFVRPSILMPQSVYLDTLRNFMLSADGISFNNYIPLENSDISFSLSIGESVLDDMFGTVALAETAGGRWDSNTNLYSHFSWDSMNLSLGISFSKLDFDFIASPSSFVAFDVQGVSFQFPLIDGSIETDFYTLSAQYRLENWEVTAEFAHRDITSDGFNTSDKTPLEMNGYYVQAKYIFDQPLTATIRYDVTDTNQRNVLPELAEAKDLTIGLSWRINEQWMLALEHHFINGGTWIPPLNNVGDPDLKENWSLSAVQLSYRF